MSIDWTPLADLIETHDRFLVTTHVRPDGDALGSEVGMAGLLRQKGKDVRVVNVEPDPAPVRLPRPRRDALRALRDAGPARPTWPTARSLVILDLSAWSQLGDMAGCVREFAGPAGGDRPPRQPGRPRGDLPQGHVGRGDRHAGRPGHPGAGGHVHAARWRPAC